MVRTRSGISDTRSPGLTPARADGSSEAIDARMPSFRIVQEYLHDPDTSDTQIESVYTYTIVEAGQERVEQDTHTTGLFPMATWTRLLREAGFQEEMVRLPINEGGYGGFLFVAELG